MAKAATLVVVLASTAVWVGLGVIGEGGVSAFFSRPPLTALALVTLALALAAPFTQGNISSGQKEDRANRWVLAALGGLGLLDGVVPALCDRLGLLTIDHDAQRWTGVALYALGGVLRLWPVFVLGRRFSGLVAIQEGHTLVTTGVYRYLRNTSYVGLVIMTLGWGLAFNAWAGVILTGLFLPPLIARMGAEERLLGAQFGTDYEAYRRRTWRLVPFLY